MSSALPTPPLYPQVEPGPSPTPATGDIHFVSKDRLRIFSAPLEIEQAHSLDEVLPALRRVEEHTQQGRYAAGFIAYEAGPAFDQALAAHPTSDLPLLWFGIYEAPRDAAQGPQPGPLPHTPDWKPDIEFEPYRESIARIHELIAAGDTYQVNYTFPMTTRFTGMAYPWFRRLIHAQRVDYAAYLDLGRFNILSLSPELLFRLDGDSIVTKPMKGTRERGLWSDQDRERARELQTAPKDRAENIMIVDLLRNDLGRIARPGTVAVDSLFDVERFDTVWQMTSTISARTDASMTQVFSALFPPGSVTGAPKIRTTQIIRELETNPRGVYCGAVGWWGPDRQAEFNVAIRTMTVDILRVRATYPVGAGITWDSNAADEWRESIAKAAVLHRAPTSFDLIESLLWDGSIFLFDDHIARLKQSAEYFAFPFDEDRARATIRHAAHRSIRPAKLRLLLSADGACHAESEPLQVKDRYRVKLATAPVDSKNPFLYHKTTARAHLDTHKRHAHDVDEVILWNERGELTEGTYSNIVLELDGERRTPPIASGLLPGVMRAHLIACGEIAEAVLTPDDLRRADRIWLVNSVRKWMPAERV